MARLLDLTIGMNGRQRLTVELDSDFRQTFDELHQTDVDITVKKHREKRSRSANNYAWVLIDKIAQKTRKKKIDVYRNAIREIGGVSEFVLVQNKALRRFRNDWESRGLGYQVEEFESKIDGCTTLLIYYGSSSFDVEQMSALIDSLVQDAQSIGIETRPQEEIDSLLKEYEK